MRIAILCDTSYPNVGGTEFVIHHLAREWGEAGHEVCLINLVSALPMIPGAPYRVLRLPWLRGSTRYGFHKPPFLQYASTHLQLMLKAFRPDMLSVHYAYPSGVLAHEVHRREGYPYVITLHGRDITPFEWGYRRMYPLDDVLRNVINASSGAVALSTYLHRQLLELGIANEHIYDIPNGVELDRFRTPSPTHLRKNLGLPDDSRIVVSIGRVHVAKQFDVGMRAFARVAARFPNAYYVIVGKGAPDLQAEAEKLGIGRQFIGHAPLHGADLVAAYQQADVYFSSSKFEVLSLALLEAMAAGRPVVATRVSGTEDVVLEGKTGFLADVGDVEGLSNHLGRLLASAELRESMHNAGLERIQSYGWTTIANRYIDLYQRVLSR